ncbi:MAG: energy-coupling factor transporter transmembrane protein EcfT [Acidimicrobiia bacterium]|nr:energy-coupling factor transporter transmembrane protein EcfT [Acidimicrobiia bacterium]
MHYLVMEEWARRDSPLHRRDARVKMILLLVFLVWIGTARPAQPEAYAAYASILLVAALASRLPLLSLLWRAALVLPFAATFALLSWMAGDAERAASLVLKSSFSAFAVLLVVATTPMPALLAAVESLAAPKMLVMVVQFLYRYLFVLSEKAQHMWMAAQCRGGIRRASAGGAIAVLFASSHARAEGIHRAMLARGFAGHMPLIRPSSLHWLDISFLATGILVLSLGRWLWIL